MFLSCHLKVNVVEDVIQSGIEDHTFGPTNVREQFSENELTLGKKRLLQKLLQSNFLKTISKYKYWNEPIRYRGVCGGQKMTPHVNKWSPLDGAHE